MGRSAIADTLDARGADPTAPTLDPDEAPPAAPLAPERIGRFHVLDLLGEGGMGRVYAAYDPNLDRRVALKLLRSGVERPEQSRRIRREAHAMARLSHPNVAQIYDVGAHRGQTWIAMEYVDGVTLAEWQADPRPWPAVLAMYARVGAGLAAAHDAGMMHRDFKPQNVLVGHDGRPRIIDFGLARAEHDAPDPTPAADPPGRDDLLASPLTLAGSVLGTPAYMAPEQIRGEAVGPACDQFAFAVALFEALNGIPPFGGDGLTARLARIEAGAIEASRCGAPTAILGAIDRGLSAAPEDRWPSMHALLDAIGWDERDDRSVGARSRLTFFTGLALVMAASLAVIVWATLDGMPTSAELIVTDGAGVAVVFGLAWVFRRRIGATAHTRRLSTWLLLTLASPIITRVAAILNGIDARAMLSVDLMAMSILALLAGFLVARWAFMTALAFALGSIGVAVFEAPPPMVFSVAIFAGAASAVIGTWREVRSLGLDPGGRPDAPPAA